MNHQDIVVLFITTCENPKVSIKTVSLMSSQVALPLTCWTLLFHSQDLITYHVVCLEHEGFHQSSLVFNRRR